MLTGKQDTLTYRCADLRPLLKQLREEVAAKNTATRDSISPTLEPAMQEVQELINNRSEKVIKDLDARLEETEKATIQMAATLASLEPRTIDKFPVFVSSHFKIGPLIKAWNGDLAKILASFEQSCRPEGDKDLCRQNFESAAILLRKLNLAAELIYEQYPKAADNAFDFESQMEEYFAFISSTYPYFSRPQLDGQSASIAEKEVNLPRLKMLAQKGVYTKPIDALDLYRKGDLKASLVSLEYHIKNVPDSNGTKQLVLYGLTQISDENNLILISKDSISIRTANIETEAEIEALWYLRLRLEQDLKLMQK